LRSSLFLAIAVLSATVRAQAEAPKGQYVGSASTLVEYLDPNTLQTIASERLARKVTVVIGDPKSVAGQIENNPFTLAVAPKRRLSSPVPGEIFAASARISAATGNLALYQYWTLQNSATGFAGALFNNYSEAGLAKDRINAHFHGPGGAPASYLMHDGRIAPGLQSTLSAVIAGRQMTLKIRGHAFVPGQAIARFRTKINARRQPAG
jgi:hypothetical protein